MGWNGVKVVKGVKWGDTGHSLDRYAIIGALNWVISMAHRRCGAWACWRVPRGTYFRLSPFKNLNQCHLKKGAFITHPKIPSARNFLHEVLSRKKDWEDYITGVQVMESDHLTKFCMQGEPWIQECLIAIQFLGTYVIVMGVSKHSESIKMAKPRVIQSPK